MSKTIAVFLLSILFSFSTHAEVITCISESATRPGFLHLPGSLEISIDAQDVVADTRDGKLTLTYKRDSSYQGIDNKVDNFLSSLSGQTQNVSITEGEGMLTIVELPEAKLTIFLSGNSYLEINNLGEINHISCEGHRLTRVKPISK